MNESIRVQIDETQRMTVGQLREKYREVFREESRSNHRQFLIRKIAWRLQANAEGGLSERARRRALEIANDADLRIRGPKEFINDLAAGVTERTVVTKIRKSKDGRVPKPGTDIVREFRGRKVVVRILEDGFEYQGQRFRSLSAIASQVAGTRWNGFLFFGLNDQPEERIA
jgi:hypothetical protein